MPYLERTFSPARTGEAYQANAVRKDSGVLSDFIDLIYKVPPAPQRFVELHGEEVIQNELIGIISEPAFWMELGQDIDILEGDSDHFTDLDSFVKYFHPEKNRRAAYRDTVTQRDTYYEHHEWEPGKYWGYSRAWQLAHLGQFDDWLQFFKPPDASEELLVSIEATQRKILPLLDTAHVNPLRERLLEGKLFWEDFSQALSKGSETDKFKDFLYSLTFGANSLYEGEGPQMYQYLKNVDTTVPSRWTEDKKEAWQENRSLPPRQRYARPFYDAAPVEIKLQLRSIFPKDFGEISLEEMNEILALPSEFSHVIQALSLFRPDSQRTLINTLSHFINARQQQQDVSLSPQVIGKLMEQVIAYQEEEFGENEQIKVKPTIDTAVQDIGGFLALINIGDEVGNDAERTEEQRALEDAFTEHYFIPIFRKLAYKPAAKFWSEYLKAHPDELTVPSELFGSYVESIFDPFLTDNTAITGYAKQKLLPQVRDFFMNMSLFAPEVQYFQAETPSQERKHLFLHQIEDIMRLLNESAIDANEAGSGKTVELVLGALNLIDKLPITRDGQRRVLVVGTKSVIDNWEGELRKHVDLADIDVTNLTFTQQEKKLDVAYSFKTRLDMFADRLRESSASKHVALVNYDVFRNQRFQALLDETPFDVAIVDEAHNVKSGVLSSVNRQVGSADQGSSVAQRTQGLYDYLLHTEGLSVFLSTGTPYVKSLTEPLIMAHLVAPEKVPLEKIRLLRNDIVGTNQAVSEVMIRHRKDEVLDLPELGTAYESISLQDIPNADKQYFLNEARRILQEIPTSSGRFYALLNLEAQVKYPWLIQKTQDLIDDGRKVVIFSPFVNTQDRYTAGVSTDSIATRLYDAGITEVGLLDGSVTMQERLNAQHDFLTPEGIKVLVGNYQTAGESITLNSPDNRATEVLLFIGPNSVSRYIQSINRTHRPGQTEPVTVHIPFVTGDLLERAQGTFDERIFKRLVQDLRLFDAVVDGNFFLAGKDFYQEIARSSGFKYGGKRVPAIDLAEDREVDLNEQPTIFGIKPPSTFSKRVRELKSPPVLKERSHTPPSHRLKEPIGEPVDVYKSVVAENIENNESTLESVIITPLVDLPRRMHHQIQLIDRLDGVSIANKKALLAFSIWQNDVSPSAIERVAKALGIKPNEVDMLIERVISEEELEATLNKLQSLK